MVASIVIAIVVPFFSDLMNIYSSLGIFTLSFMVPPILWCLANWQGLSRMQFGANVLVTMLSSIGCILGIYAAAQQIDIDWKTCNYKITL